MTERQDRRSITVDERARVPFAMIGVLLLVSSITVVYALDSRSDPDPQVDRSLIVDQTESSANSVFRGAVTRAVDTAGQSPLTSTDSSSAIGSAIESSDDEPFEGYAKVLVYLEAKRSMPIAGQERENGVKTTVSVGNGVDWTDSADIEENVLNEVQLEYGGSMEKGTVRATLNGVTIELEDEGEPIDTIERDVTVTVGTPTFELHEKAEEYKSELNKNYAQGGLGDQLGYRIWALAWGKTYYDRLSKEPQRAFENVTPNEHTEVMANDAIFTVQQQVFGTTGPYEDRVMQVPMACMGNDVLSTTVSSWESKEEEINQKLDDYNESVEPEIPNIEELCDQGVFSPDGDMPDLLSGEEVVQMLMGQDINKAFKFRIHPIAELAFTEMLYDGSEKDSGDFALGIDTVFSNNDWADYEHEDIPASEWKTQEEYIENLNSTDQFDRDYIASFYPEYYPNYPEEGKEQDSGGGEIAGDILNLLWNEMSDDRRTIEDVINDVYSVDPGARDGSSVANGLTKSDFETFESPGENYTRDGSPEYEFVSVNPDVTTTTEDPGSSLNRLTADPTLATINITYRATIKKEQQWVNVSDENDTEMNSTTEDLQLSQEVEAYAEFHNDIEVDNDKGVRDAFSSSSSWDPNLRNSNWEGLEDDVLDAVFAYDDPGGLESEMDDWELWQLGDLTDELDNGDSPIVDDPASVDLTGSTSYTGNVDQDYLESWLMQDLAQVHEDKVTGTDPVEVSVFDFLFGSSPVNKFSEEVGPGQNSGTITGEVSGDYDNLADLARAEVRYAYFENTQSHYETVKEAEEKSTGRLKDALNNAFDGFDQMMNDLEHLVDNVVGGVDPDGEGTIESGPILGDVNYQVSESPTYLPLEGVNRSEVPAVRPPGGTITDVDGIDDAQHGALSARYSDAVGYPGFPLIPWPGLFFLQVDAYMVQVQGEYARFEIRADTTADASSTESTTYVRQDRSVTVDTPDGTQQIGNVDPIRFSSDIPVPLIVPSPQLYTSGSPGVGDYTAPFDPSNSDHECSPAWDNVGPSYDGPISDSDCTHALDDFVSNLEDTLAGDG